MAEPLAAAPAPRVRCSVLSASRAEPMLGTAFSQAGVLLVEQPGPWGHAGLSASRFDPDVARALEQRARAAGLRVLAIRRHGRRDPDGTGGADPNGAGADGGTGAPRRRWAILPADPLAGHHRPEAGPASLRWGEFGADAELLDVPLDGSTGVPDAAPLYLVCAHSKRDVCCAVRGRPLAAALQALRPGRVWECSHTGGHRFAPIVLALPVGALYGRVPDDGAAAIVAASERGEVIAPLLRGLLGHQPVEQAALGHLLLRLDETSPATVEVVSATRDDATEGPAGATNGAAGTGGATENGAGGAGGPGGERWTVRMTHAGRTWRARLAVDLVPTPYASCAKPAAKPTEQITLLGLDPA